MKRLITAIVLFLSLYSKAQEQSRIAYPITNLPIGYDTYGDVTYYSSEKNVFNLRNYSLGKAGDVATFKVNPSGSSYAVIVSKKGKKMLKVYDLWHSKKKLSEIVLVNYEPLSLCYSCDGRDLLVGGADGNIYIYDAINLLLVASYPTNVHAQQLCMSSDGQMLALVNGNSVSVWNWKDRILRREFIVSDVVSQVDFSGDSKVLAVLTADGNLSIYETSTFEEDQTINALGLASDCSFHPEGKYIAVVTGESRIAIINRLNAKDRHYIDSPDPGIGFLRFVKNAQRTNVFLAYGTPANVVFEKMDYLSPLRSKLIADKLQERMDEWVKQLPAETLEEYQLRVNEETRLEQIRLFEEEIINELALEELGLPQITLGSYSNDQQMLALGFDNMPEIFLSVPEEELGTFMDPSNLEFQNMKYGLNNEDEFVMLYADVFNKETGKTYTYNNTQGQFLDFIADEATFTPLKLVQMSMMEENSLAGLSEQIVNEAKENRLISDHTQITVKTNIRPAVDANGQNVRNYEVRVSYTVDQEFSTSEDYAGGKYKIEDSNAGMAMLTIVKQALEKEFAKYVKPEKNVRIKISGAADASPIRRTIKYDGCYGDFVKEPIYLQGELSNITVTEKEGIKDNDQLAFLRAVGVKEYMFRNIESLHKMQTDVTYDITVSEKKGSEYRKVSVELTFEDAFE